MKTNTTNRDGQGLPNKPPTDEVDRQGPETVRHTEVGTQGRLDDMARVKRELSLLLWFWENPF